MYRRLACHRGMKGTDGQRHGVSVMQVRLAGKEGKTLHISKLLVVNDFQPRHNADGCAGLSPVLWCSWNKQAEDDSWLPNEALQCSWQWVTGLQANIHNCPYRDAVKEKGIILGAYASTRV